MPEKNNEIQYPQSDYTEFRKDNYGKYSSEPQMEETKQRPNPVPTTKENK